jgi:hypothetical protein
MNIKMEDVFIYILNIAGAIVSQNSEITPNKAVERALETIFHAKMCAEAWGNFHDKDGNLKDPLELLQSLGSKLSAKGVEKLGDMLAKGFGESGKFPQGEKHDL